MSKLLSANMERLRKNRLFWLCMASVLVISALMMLNDCRQAVSKEMLEYHYGLDEYFFGMVPALGIFFAVFSSMFIGTEYSDGTIRNKLIVGHSRTAVYLSNYFTVLAAVVMMMAAWILGAMVGIPFLEAGELGIGGFVLYILICLLSALAFSAILTLSQMLIPNKAVSAVFSILLIMGLLICASMLYNALCQAETISGAVITGDGMQILEPTANPYYVGGIKRKIFEWIVDALPTGQGILLANKEVVHPLRMVLCSAGIGFAATLGGICLFGKKDLR